MPVMAPPPNTAVFLARAWWEDGRFRARISYSANTRAEPDAETRLVTVDPADVGRHLAIWLESAAASS